MECNSSRGGTHKSWSPESGVSGTASAEVGPREWGGIAAEVRPREWSGTAAEVGPREWSGIASAEMRLREWGDWNSSSGGGT